MCDSTLLRKACVKHPTRPILRGQKFAISPDNEVSHCVLCVPCEGGFNTRVGSTSYDPLRQNCYLPAETNWVRSSFEGV